jgi:phage repressor protein C with HTH and peptisase S24 domain
MKKTKALRIKEFSEHKNLSFRAIERIIGASHGILSSALKRNGDINEDLSKLLDEFPELNPLWLYEGKGEMILKTYENLENRTNMPNVEESKGHYSIKPKEIPVYNVDGPNDEINIFNKAINLKPAFFFTMPELSDCDFGLRYYGKSMEPDIESGDYIALKSINSKIVQFGETFFIVTTDNQRMVRKIKKGRDAQNFLLSALNKDFDEFEVERNQVHSLYIIKAILKQRVI